MAIKYLLPDALRGSNADDDYLRTVLKYGDTTEYTAHIKACKDYGVTATFYKNGTKQALLSELKNGFPTATGILHRGHASRPTGGGHWMLLIGDEGGKGVFHDPYGEMDNVNGGYVKIGSGGQGVKYSWVNWLKRWEVEGARTGWFMTFRSTITPPPRVATTNTWDGVVAAARAAGAKFPEVVAAQWALESGYGKHTSGKNNYFGIKSERDGIGSLVSTTEFVGGMEIRMDAWFKDFPDLQTCVTYLVDRWYRDYQRFKGVNRATSAEECAKLLVVEKYATDPAYADKLIRILRENV
jgi:hypothetical protein